jgi:tRNA threonylcarbamoyladenosine biosynthesis protein TsaE
MTSVRNLNIISQSAGQTEDIAQKIGDKLLGAEVIELVADLGGGKTTFVRGLAQGIGSTNNVSSPSFTISNEYSGTKLELIHFDFYRLEKAGLIENSLVEFVGKPNNVVVIEWADIVKHVLPEKRLTINFSFIDENSRRLALSYPESLEYLVEGLS